MTILGRFVGKNITPSKVRNIQRKLLKIHENRLSILKVNLIILGNIKLNIGRFASG